MNSVHSKPVLIEKEQVRRFSFPSEEVLSSTEEIARRRNDLSRALILGNVDHHKVKIIFQDSENLKMVETTIWAVTDTRIILKSGTVIPINRIVEIIH